MSIEYNLNLEVKLAGLHEDVVMWFKAMNNINSSRDYDMVASISPYVLRDSRMEVIGRYAMHDESDHYSFTETDQDGVYKLTLSICHKNKDDDMERFIHFIAPFIIDYLNFDSLILLTADSTNIVHVVNIDETANMKDTTIVDSIALDRSVQPYEVDGLPEYEDVAYLSVAREYLLSLMAEVDDLIAVEHMHEYQDVQ